ncbi:MAG: chemotaxis-specific protein-glutamate methyltransferase CheB [Deltaproteobacteria bacterium]|nr:MAG: chemotaxis-specific protein-glutamate methyltransferase CheB [Deltaproteobacteria bacterium]
MIRVLIADDSPLVRAVLRDLLAQATDIDIVAEVGDGRAAVAQTALLRPDVVIMDVMMPEMDGIEAVATIMASTPTPILMLSANTDPTDSRSAFSAIRLGALDVMAKPAGATTDAFGQMAELLINKVRSLSRIRVMHHFRAHRRSIMPAPAPAPAAREGQRRILAIGASTGGPKVVMQLLKELPGDFAAAVLIVQHIADGFAAGFAEWLDREVPLPVALARDGEPVRSGRVLVAPNGAHLTVNDAGCIALSPAPPLHCCRPAVDALFQSLAAAQRGGETVGVILTGMGSDGAAGLQALHRQGAFTIAQDEASCAVFGMPKAAIERGAVDQILPLAEITAAVRPLFGR